MDMGERGGYSMSLDFVIFEKGESTKRTYDLFSRNYTHNVTPMWKLANIYDELYNSNGKQPEEVIEKLKKGLEDMQKHPEKYVPLNPLNGWGDYNGAIEFLEEVIKACENNPESEIYISK